MIWQGFSLIDGHRALATATPDSVTAGHTVLRITSDNPVKFRAFDVASGDEYELRKAGITVSRYAADCAGRHYTLRRAGLRRDIRDASGELVAVVRGRASGDLEVDVAEPTLRVGGFGELELVDLAFMTWGLTLVDAPARRTRY